MQSSISPEKTAILQALGIDCYKGIESIEVNQLCWIEDVCDLLKIEIKSVLFDSAHVHFDKNEQVLHLPANYYGSESNLKQTIWREIQPFVYFDSQ